MNRFSKSIFVNAMCCLILNGAAILPADAEQPAARGSGSPSSPATITPAPVSPAPEQIPLTYKQWDDPLQNAFSLMVPDKWPVQGGMFQPSALDVRQDVQLVSPDGSIVLFMGDSKLPPHTMPHRSLTMAGYRIGNFVNLGGAQMQIEPYARAQEFLASYGPNRLSRTCTNVSTDSIQDQPALAANATTIYSQTAVAGVRSEFTMADGHFHCLRQGKPYVGYIIAGVQGAFGSGPGTWLVPHLWGYICTPEREPIAAHVLGMLMTTFRLNPQWVAKINQNNAAVVQEVNATNQAMIQTVMAACQRQNAATQQFIKTEQKANTMVMGAWQRSMDSHSRIANEWSNTILGIHTVEDPSTGERRTVDNSYSYYFKDRSGNIVGNQTGYPPGAGYTQMNILRGQ